MPELKTEEAVDPKDEKKTEDDQAEEPKPTEEEIASEDEKAKAAAVEVLRKKMAKSEKAESDDDEPEPTAPEKPKAAKDEPPTREKATDLDERQQRAAQFAGLSLPEAQALAEQHPEILEKFAKSQEAVDRKMAEAGRATTRSEEGEPDGKAERNAGGADAGKKSEKGLDLAFEEGTHYLSEPAVEALNDLVASHNALAEIVAAQQDLLAQYHDRFEKEDAHRESDAVDTFFDDLDPRVYSEFGEGRVDPESEEGKQRQRVVEKAAGLRRGFPDMTIAQSLDEALAIVAGRTAEQRRFTTAAAKRGRSVTARPPQRGSSRRDTRSPEEKAQAAVAEKLKSIRGG